jgi:SAM-dependent methyltransferase
MPDFSNFYNLTYGNFANPVLAEIRQETFGEDIGQNSWLTADEYRQFIGWLELNPSSQVLDIGSGSGGPAIFLGHTIGCHVTSLDINRRSVCCGRGGASCRLRYSRVHPSRLQNGGRGDDTDAQGKDFLP